MSFKLIIKQKTDPQLLTLFNNDVYADLTLITTHQHLHLTQAYLAIDSDYFARIPIGVKSVDLSAMNQVYLIPVLRSLYGDELQASSIFELNQIFNVVSFLEIQEYMFLMEKAIFKLHSQHHSNPTLQSIEMLEFSMKNNIAKELMVQLHIQNQLNALQTIRNYLQLSKLSKQHLDHLLLEFLAREGEKGYQIINRILQNYFNRKGFRASEYFQNHNLAPLKAVWEYFHHKLVFGNQSLVLSKTYPETLLRSTVRRTSIKLKMMKLNSLPNIKEEALEYECKLLKSEKIDEQKLLDIKMASLQNEKKEKDQKIGQLRKQLIQLKALNQLRNQNQQQNYIEDLSLCQVVRSRKLRQKQRLKEQITAQGDESFGLQKVSTSKKVKSNASLM